MSGWTDVFLGVIAVATLVTATFQIGMLVAAGLLAGRLFRLTRRVEQDLEPIFGHLDSIGRDAAQQIVYRALTEKLRPDSGFEDFRTASLEVARELWGEDSPEYTGTNESFAAVGLDGTWEAPEVEGC